MIQILFSKIPRFKFSGDFSLSINPTHFSNTDESLKISRNYHSLPRKTAKYLSNLAFDHPALQILDVFKDQLTELVLNELKGHHILTYQVLANMTAT